MSSGLRPKEFSSPVNPNVGELTRLLRQWETHVPIVDRLIRLDDGKSSHFCRLSCYSERDRVEQFLEKL
jgi:hypothetical protein